MILQQPDILLATKALCKVISILKMKARYGRRHTKTAELKARNANNLTPRGQPNELLPGTALHAGRGNSGLYHHPSLQKTGRKEPQLVFSPLTHLQVQPQFWVRTALSHLREQGFWDKKTGSFFAPPHKYIPANNLLHCTRVIHTFSSAHTRISP